MKYKLKVSIIGIPNCGKSTLLNRILQKNICIVSNKPHTTRENTLGILTINDKQIVFIDTPGINSSMKKDAIEMKNIAEKSLRNIDMIICMFDGTKKYHLDIIDSLSKINIKKIAVINKIDIINKAKLLPITDEIKDYFSEIFYISAYSGECIEELVNYLFNQCIEGDWEFDENIITTRDQNQCINDRTTEVIFNLMYNEIPYNCNVSLENIETKEDQSLIIHQNINIPKNHKHIFLGKIKEISMSSRISIETFLKKKVHLFIKIKEIN